MLRNIKKSGSLLLELLIVIGVVAIIIPIVAQIVVSSLNTNKWSIDNKVADGLVNEAIKTVENVSFEQWQNIYGKSAGHYHLLNSSGVWSVVSDDESLSVNNLSYTRYFIISNVCRDDATKTIITTAGVPPCTTGNSNDPSVLKITVTVSWPTGTISKDYYLARWRNQICNQTSWTSVGATTSCATTMYESKNNIDISTPGSLKLQAN